MDGVNGSTRTIGAAPAAPTTTTTTALTRGEGSLLPAPDSRFVLSPDEDTMTTIYAFMAESRSRNMKDGRVDVGRVADKRAAEDKKRLDAELKAAESEEDDGRRGFFGEMTHLVGNAIADMATFRPDKLQSDTWNNMKEIADNPKFWRELAKGAMEVAKWAAVVVAAAVAVFTCGAGTVLLALAIAAVVLSAAAAVDSDTHVCAKAFGEDTANKIDLGLSIGSAVCSMGAGSGASIGGAAATAVRAGQVAGGVCAVSGGVAQMEVAKFDSRAADAHADAQAAKNRVKDMDRDMEMLLAMVKELDRSHEKALETLAGAIHTKAQTRVALTSARA